MKAENNHLLTNCFLFRSESTGQVFLLTLHYLYERLKDVPQDEWHNFILSYDNMCNLCKLRGARANLPLPEPYDLLWLKITKVIDRLHLRYAIHIRTSYAILCIQLSRLKPNIQT